MVETPQDDEEVTEVEDTEADIDAGEEANETVDEEESGESKEDADDDEDDEDEDEDDDDEEEKDPLDEMREECAKTPACEHAAHHFQECVERVTAEMEEEDYAHKHYKEDCVEEFFHLQHCVNDCVAPKLFYKLK